MPFNHSFDAFVDRRGTGSTKWDTFDDDVLPMWIADMDFLCPPAVRDALSARVEHGIFGYTLEPRELRDLVVAHLDERYRWRVSPDAIVFLPSVVVGFNLACQTVARPGDGILIQTPVYFPILAAPKNARAESQLCPMTRSSSGRYEIDFERLEETASDRTRLHLQCNPHNPVARDFSEAELQRMAEFCLRRGLTVCSDEIHADFVYDGQRHTPIASLSPEIERRSITLTAPSKAFNIAGLHFAAAIVPNKELREQYVLSKRGLVPSVNALAYTAAVAAYRDDDGWFGELLSYLQANRDLLIEFVRSELPGVSVGPIEATYLAWLDCRDAGIPGDPYEFFLREARVAAVPGAIFGSEGEGFVRLNFACPRARLVEGLERLRDALRRVVEPAAVSVHARTSSA